MTLPRLSVRSLVSRGQPSTHVTRFSLFTRRSEKHSMPLPRSIDQRVALSEFRMKRAWLSIALVVTAACEGTTEFQKPPPLGGDSASTGGGIASVGGGSASVGGGSASTGGGTASTGGGTASTGGGSASTGGGSASTGGGTSAAGGGAPANRPPIVTAGRDQILQSTTTTATLTGSASDPDGDTLTFTWALVGASGPTLASPTLLTTQVTGLTAGTFTFQLTVNDGHGGTASDTMQIMSTAAPLSDLYVVTTGQGATVTPRLVYESRAATTGVEWGGNLGKTFHMAIFDVDASVVVTVTKLHSTATSAVVRPGRLGLGPLTATVNSLGSTVSFTLPHAAKFTVEFGDDANNINALAVIAQPAELPAEIPATVDGYVVSAAVATPLTVPNTKSIVIFPSGVHEIGLWHVPTTVTEIYLAPGAWVRGYIVADGSNGPMKIHGRGVVSADIYPYHYTAGTPDVILHLVGITGGSHHLIEGITLIDSTNYTLLIDADSSEVRNVSLHGFRYNNDALGIRGDQILVHDTFMHINDDLLALSFPVTNLMVRDSVLWPAGGGAVLQLGWWPHSVSDLTLQNLDIIHADWGPDQQDAGLVSCIGQDSPDTTYNPVPFVQRVTVTDVYFDTPVDRLVDIRMIRPGNPTPPWPNRFDQFQFTNIHLDHQGTPLRTLIFLDAQDATHAPTNFTFTNLSINNTRVTASTTSLLSSILSVRAPAASPTFN